MAPKKARTGSSGIDRNKFVSVEAQQRHIKALLNKPSVPEREIDLKYVSYTYMISVIRRRNWETFCAHPDAAVIPVVREFYANVVEHENGVVFCRGKRVSFDSRTINKLYNIPDVENDEYTEFINGEVDLDAVINLLCNPGTEWRYARGVPSSFKASALKFDYKAWHHFVSAKILPSKHTSDVSKERAILIYAILSGKSLDIGQLLFANILHTASTPRDSLSYPSLITALCKQAGVQWSPDEEITFSGEINTNMKYSYHSRTPKFVSIKKITKFPSFENQNS